MIPHRCVCNIGREPLSVFKRGRTSIEIDWGSEQPSSSSFLTFSLMMVQAGGAEGGRGFLAPSSYSSDDIYGIFPLSPSISLTHTHRRHKKSLDKGPFSAAEGHLLRPSFILRTLYGQPILYFFCMCVPKLQRWRRRRQEGGAMAAILYLHA